MKIASEKKKKRNDSEDKQSTGKEIEEDGAATGSSEATEVGNFEVQWYMS